tara:strand:- start:5166 stop:8096 length:2931 start_codon:yes stop_codon:yes gene_type:complete
MLPLTFSLFAQTPSSLEVQGQIKDGTSPIPGATVLIKGEQRGTVSDFNGLYNITAQPNDTLIISYIGYTPVEEPVNNRNTINIVMQEDATTLREVVINAGYYAVKDRERTGSISRITAEEIENQPVNNPLATMQGRMAGVDISETSGVPGSGFNIQIRGRNSIAAGNAPLYIIDGVPIDSQTMGYNDTSGAIIPGNNISPLNAINPASIASIEVLKDADATAIYGSRGANGVVLITTKKGKEGKTRLSIQTTTGIAHTQNNLKLLNTQQYLEMRREAFANDGIEEYPFNAYDINGTWDQNRYTNWQKELLGKQANLNRVQASVSGGNKNTRFFLSGMYQNETTIYPGEFKYDRLTANTNINHNSNNQKFELALNLGYSLENNNLPGLDLSFTAPRLAPNAPALFDEEGNLNWENSSWTNPLSNLEGSYNSDTKNLFSNLSVGYNITPSLKAKINTGYNTSQLNDNNAMPHTMFDPAFGLTSSNSLIFVQENDRASWIVEPQLNWSKDWEISTLDLLLGSTFQKQTFDRYGFIAIGFPSNLFINNISAATTLNITNENKTEYTSQSLFARINYSFKEKLYLNITGRRDGSSRFGPGNKYGNFGAVGAAWLFSEELDAPWLSFGKIRSGYGITGNDQIGDYQYLQNYNITDDQYDENIGLVPIRLLNPNFKWEENKKWEMALDLGFFQNRLSTTIAYYNNRSSNQLIQYPLPATTGFTGIQGNLDALVENYGWEFELSANIFRKNSFKWSADLNLSIPKNKLLEFPGLEDTSFNNQLVIGQPLSIVKLYELKGVNPETGLFEFVDFNEDGMITPLEDRQYIADFSPKFYGGLNNNLEYKNWALNVFFQFMKRQGYNQYRLTGTPGTLANQPIGAMDRWQAPGDQAFMQRFTSGADPEALNAYSQFTQSNGAVSDASFIRLKTLVLSYKLPLQQQTSCSISLQGQNLFTITNFKGTDPEQRNGFLPPLRRIALGVELNF